MRLRPIATTDRSDLYRHVETRCCSWHLSLQGTGYGCTIRLDDTSRRKNIISVSCQAKQECMLFIGLLDSLVMFDLIMVSTTLLLLDSLTCRVVVVWSCDVMTTPTTPLFSTRQESTHAYRGLRHNKGDQNQRDVRRFSGDKHRRLLPYGPSRESGNKTCRTISTSARRRVETVGCDGAEERSLQTTKPMTSVPLSDTTRLRGDTL